MLTPCCPFTVLFNSKSQVNMQGINGSNNNFNWNMPTFWNNDRPHVLATFFAAEGKVIEMECNNMQCSYHSSFVVWFNPKSVYHTRFSGYKQLEWHLIHELDFNNTCGFWYHELKMWISRLSKGLKTMQRSFSLGSSVITGLRLISQIATVLLLEMKQWHLVAEFSLCYNNSVLGKRVQLNCCLARSTRWPVHPRLWEGICGHTTLIVDPVPLKDGCSWLPSNKDNQKSFHMLINPMISQLTSWPRSIINCSFSLNYQKLA